MSQTKFKQSVLFESPFTTQYRKYYCLGSHLKAKKIVLSFRCMGEAPKKPIKKANLIGYLSITYFYVVHLSDKSTDYDILGMKSMKRPSRKFEIY